MAITSFTAEALDANTWRLAWVSDLAGDVTFYLWRDGLLVLTTALGSTIVSVGAGESPVFEVFDDAGDVPADAHPRWMMLQWYGQGDTTDEYRVQQFVGAAWTDVATVRESGLSVYSWRSPTLADSTTHQFRVVPLGANGNLGTAAELVALVVGYPDVPAVGYAYNGAATPTVTITAA